MTVGVALQSRTFATPEELAGHVADWIVARALEQRQRFAVCLCGGSTINKSGEAAYKAAISSIVPGECECPREGQPTCVEGTCIICGLGPPMPGCPDAG